MQNPVFTCLDATTLATKGTTCLPGDLVRVEVTAPYSFATPVLGSLGPFQMKGSSTVEIQ